MLMYGTCMVLTGIVTQIFLSWMTHNLEHLLSFLIEKPRVAHLHGAGTSVRAASEVIAVAVSHVQAAAANFRLT